MHKKNSSLSFVAWWLIYFYCWIIYHHQDVSQFIYHLLKDILVASKFGQLGIKLL
jgi:hypothetical protein